MSVNCTITPQASDCCGIYTGKGVPSSSIGSNESIFVSETSPYSWYVKKNGTWVLIGSLKGSNGIDGSNQILLNDMTHSAITGTINNADVFSYSFDVADLASNGDYISIKAILSATNSSTYANPVQLQWLFDGTGINDKYYLYNPSQAQYIIYDIILSRKAVTGAANIICFCQTTTKYSTSSAEVIEELPTAITKSLVAPATYTIALKGSATSTTIVPVQLLITKFKMI